MALVAPGAPGAAWFQSFFDEDDETGNGFKVAIDRITSGKPVDREAVEGLRRVSLALRRWILEPANPTARDRIRSAFATIKPFVLGQLTEVADRIASTAEQRPDARVRVYRNIFWRMYACEVALLEGLNDGEALGAVAKEFAEALWEWEKAPGGEATPATVEKLKRNRDKIRELRDVHGAPAKK
jgi:hypothetical protein